MDCDVKYEKESLLETRIMLKWRMSISDVNADKNLRPTILLREGSLKTYLDHCPK